MRWQVPADKPQDVRDRDVHLPFNRDFAFNSTKVEGEEWYRRAMHAHANCVENTPRVCSNRVRSFR